MGWTSRIWCSQNNLTWILCDWMRYVCNRIYLLILRNNTLSRIKKPMKQRGWLYLEWDYLTMECNLLRCLFASILLKGGQGCQLPIWFFSSTSFRRIIFQFGLFFTIPKFLVPNQLIDKIVNVSQNKVWEPYRFNYNG